MKGLSICFLIAMSLVGCHSGSDGDASNNTATSSTPPPVAAANAPATGAGGGVAPMTSGAAGGMTPMSGSDSVEGAGGGSVGSAAKDFAKRKTANAGAGSVGQGNPDESSQ